MGTRPRRKPKRLAEKLLQIRLAFELSQSEMLKRLEADDLISYNEISKYELGLREPSLLVLLQYAQVAGVCLDVLVNDELELPARLPSQPKHTRR
ncbi:MAG TPA: helix-turn-helix transcriptional regulator [Nitrososphaera sp.]|jgi:transcriptional regulator with XRE-family HTH domain|nr:helix-turn-helix transcriptional regulator [Nitrososphaera sp.]